MRHITLSDHAGSKVVEAQNARREEYALATARYEEKLRARKERALSLKQSSHVAWKSGNYGAWMVSLRPRLALAFEAPPSVPVLRAAGRDEIVWARGSEGEQAFAEQLGCMLNDDWTLISGYRNHMGEIDKLLVGPSLVLAVEIKFLNGSVHCKAGRWSREKFDRYGNRVEAAVPIADKRGRGPDEQVNAPADVLEKYLDGRGAGCRIMRAIILTHPQSQVGDVAQGQVDFVTTLHKWDLKTLARGKRAQSDFDAQHVVNLIRQDHLRRDSNEKRANARRRSGFAGISQSM